MKEARDLHLEILSHSFYHDDDHPDDPATVHAYIETFLDENYYRGHQDKLLQLIAHAPGPVTEAREAMHASIDRYLEHRPTRRAKAEEVDSTDEVLTSTSRSNLLVILMSPEPCTPSQRSHWWS
ncbi:hypothetical protein V1522DRAFT_454634 [Lipomyces starkeyi]